MEIIFLCSITITISIILIDYFSTITRLWNRMIMNENEALNVKYSLT